MTNYKISLTLFAMAMSADAFTVSPSAVRSATRLADTTPANDFFTEEIAEEPKVAMSDSPEPSKPTAAMTDSVEPSKPIAPKVVKKKAAPHGKEGVFSPAVTALKSVMGDDELNKLRGKVISMHSEVIKNFVDTSDSVFGQAVLKGMFAVADVDRSGTVEAAELEKALKTLGFRYLNDKQVRGIFERADKDKDGHIDLDEWMKEAPKTLRTNLVKLAKQNGGDMGFLS